MAPLRDVSRSARHHGGVVISGVAVPDDMVRLIDALVDGFVQQSGCQPVADLYAVGGAVTDTTYAVFLEKVVDLIMRYKAAVLVDVLPAFPDDESNELRRQFENGELSIDAADRAQRDMWRRHLRARRQFPEQYDQHQDAGEMDYGAMFCLVRLTPAQLASLSNVI